MTLDHRLPYKNAEQFGVVTRARRAVVHQTKRYVDDCRTAIQYATGNQIEDVRRELARRFPRSNVGARQGQEILPVFAPVAQRFVDEQANAYNRNVTHEAVDEDGNVDEASTQVLQRHLGETSYCETMHAADRVTVNVLASGVFYQQKRGRLAPVIMYPCDIYPVLADDPGASKADQDDHEGFCVEVGKSKEGKKRYMLSAKGEIAFYEGSSPDRPEGVLSYDTVPYEWEQPEEKDGKWVPTMQAGQMLTIWHKRLPTDCLIPDQPSPIMACNRELNVQLSVLFDTLRFQSYAQPVLGLMNPHDPKALRAAGVRHPWIMQVGETADMLQAASTFTEQVEVLRTFVALLGMAERLSPNDLSLDGRGASLTSGFAKLVDSLPKLEARNERLVRLTAMEERYAGPRILAILRYLGLLPAGSEKLRVRVRFEGIRYPETEDERAKRYETDTKYDLTTPVAILAERERVSLEEARKRLKENAAENEPGRQEARAALSAQNGPRFPAISAMAGRQRREVAPS